MISVLALLVLLALVGAVIALAGRLPVTVPVFLLALVELIRLWPLR